MLPPPLMLRNNLLPSWTPFSEPTLTFLVDWNSPKWQNLARTTPAEADGDPVAMWDDQIGGRNIRCITEAESPTWRPSGGPSAGKGSIEWSTAATADGPLYFATGSQILNDHPFTMGVVYRVPETSVTDNGLCGRGGDANAGTLTKNDSLYRTTSQVNTDTAGNYNGIDGSMDTSWRASILAYDGATARRTYRIATSPFFFNSSSAKTGSLSFNVADTAFWVGGVTADGTTFSWCDNKHIAMVFVMARAATGANEAASLLNNLKRYAGLVP